MSTTEAINTSPFFIPTTVPSDEFSFIAYHPWLDFAILSVLLVLTFIFRAPPDGDLTPVALGAEERKDCDDAACCC